MIQSGATLNMGNQGSACYLVDRVLENGGNASLNGSSSLYLGNAVFTNRPGAVFEMRSSGYFYYYYTSPSRFDNAGIFRKSSSFSTMIVYYPIAFNNFNELDIQAGNIFFQGDFSATPASLTKLTLGGTTPGSGYSQLLKGGVLNVNGALGVRLRPGYTPVTNDTFTVVAGDSLSGVFSGFTFPSNRLSLTLSNTPSAVTLRVAGVAPVPVPVFLPPKIAGSNILLSWTATSNVTYQVERKGSITDSNWQALGGDVTTTTNVASKDDLLTTSNRIYRVHALP